MFIVRWQCVAERWVCRFLFVCFGGLCLHADGVGDASAAIIVQVSNKILIARIQILWKLCSESEKARASSVKVMRSHAEDVPECKNETEIVW